MRQCLWHIRQRCSIRSRTTAGGSTKAGMNTESACHGVPLTDSTACLERPSPGEWGWCQIRHRDWNRRFRNHTESAVSRGFPSGCNTSTSDYVLVGKGTDLWGGGFLAERVQCTPVTSKFNK